MTSRSSRLSLPKWVQTTGLVLAGILSFVLAASFSQWKNVGQSDIDVVQPVERANRPPNRRTEALPAPVPNDARQGAAVLLSARPSDGIRLNARVVYDPFGPLNMNAVSDIDTLSVEPASNPPVVPPSKPKLAGPPKTKSPQVPVAAVQVAALPENHAPPSVAATAPPLPFSVAGVIEGSRVAGGQRVAFLRQSDEVVVVRTGDSVGSNYRIDSISAVNIELTYLPLNLRQTLSITP
jgi:hypothetical protein